MQCCQVTFHKLSLIQFEIFSADSDHYPLFKLSPHLLSKQKEIEYLREISELLMMFLLPRGYLLSPAKYFVREVLACKGKFRSKSNRSADQNNSPFQYYTH